MDIKEVLELLNQRISTRIMEKFNGSSDPLAFQLSSVITDAIQDVIDQLDK